MKSLPDEHLHHRTAERPAPSGDDILQAATLLIGVYGRDASCYAHRRRAEVEIRGNVAATRTWIRITAQIEHLLRCEQIIPLN